MKTEPINKICLDKFKDICRNDILHNFFKYLNCKNWTQMLEGQQVYLYIGWVLYIQYSIDMILWLILLVQLLGLCLLVPIPLVLFDRPSYPQKHFICFQLTIMSHFFSYNFECNPRTFIYIMQHLKHTLSIQDKKQFCIKIMQKFYIEKHTHCKEKTILY